jgi:glyoxylase-like metal-dependent hydrolase (beta-lactamase superfamily II)
MKLDFLQKQTSRRDILRGSVTLTGSAFLAHLLPATLLRASAASYAQQSPSRAGLLASMRAKFNAVPMETQKSACQEPHDLPVLYRGPDGALAGLHFDPAPAEALPQQTFAVSYKLQANGETLALQHVAAAHTDTDIYVHFEKANVIQMGDLFFNGMYPYIDPGTGGKITGVIAAADKILSLAGNDTKIVAGHGPLGSKVDLTKFRDMLITSRDRVDKLKSAGKSAQEAVAEKPFADLEAM